MKQGKLIRRAVSAALAGCMMFTLSAPALAASTDALLQQSTAAKSAVSVLDEENDMTAEPAYQMNLKNGSIRVYIGEDGKQYVQQRNNEAQQKGNLWITTDGSPTNKTLTIEGGTTGAKVTLSNVNIDAPGAAVSVSGNVELVITGTNTLRSGTDHAGVEKADDNGTLTISGTGSLEAYGGNEAAGIGSRANNNVRNIVINGGTITAECTGDDGAGIGGGHCGKAENITINGGVVTATGGKWGFGIGSGYNDDSLLPTTITITGGTVKAIAKNPGAAIGALASANDLNMTGGSLTVQKSNDRLGWIIGPSSTIGEVDKNSLTGAITYLDQNGDVVDTANWDITVNRTAVNGVNYKDILGDGVLCYDIEEKTLKLKEGKSFEGDLTITAPADVSIDLEANATNVVNGNLTVNGAKDVKVTKLEGDDAAEGAIVAINGKAEISCSGDVILKNLGGSSYRGRNLTTNGLTVNGANKVTTEGSIGGQAIIDCTGDIELGNEWGTTVSKLTVNRADNVTVTSGSVNWSIENGANITCSGTVEIKGETPIEGDVKIVAGKDVFLECVGDHDAIEITAAGKVELNSYRYSYSNLGKVIFAQKKGQPYVYFTDKSSEEYKDSRITPIPETIESKYLRIEPRETYSITVKNGTAQVVGDTDGKLTTAFAGEKVTVSGENKNPSVTKFGGWKVISPEGFELTEEQKNTEENMTFTMPDSPVELKASYSFPAPVLDMQVTVKGGTIRVGEGESQTGTVFVQPGTPITVKAVDKTAEYKMFHNWKVEENVSPALGLTQGSLGSENEFGTEKITFTMPQEAVTLTAEYVKMHLVTADGGIGTASVSGSKIIDGRAAAGSTVKVSAELDGDKYPGMMFDQWEVVSPDGSAAEVKLADATSSETTFTMPDCEVTLVAHWIDGAMPEKPGIDDLDPDFSVDDGSGIAGAIVAGTLIGGASVWGGYEITTRVILNDLLPAGAAIPANRGELAMLLWQTAGKPEPAAQPAFADVADSELAKAAQWCVEQGLLDAKDGKFDPDGWMPKFKTIEVWKKAFPKQ